MRIKFKASKKDENIIRKIVERVFESFKFTGTKLDLMMDLEACHSNGNPLDFKKLLGFDDFNLLHDVYGIRNHLNRNNGKLENCFLPRCSKPSRKRS